MRAPDCFDPRRRIQSHPRWTVSHYDIDWIPDFRPCGHGVWCDTRRVGKRCAGSVEAVFVQLIRESPVPELGCVWAGVDVRHRAVRQGYLVNAFVQICHAFHFRSAIGRRPQVPRGVDTSVGFFTAETGGLTALWVLLAMRKDKIAVQGEIVVSGYHQLAGTRCSVCRPTCCVSSELTPVHLSRLAYQASCGILQASQS